MSPKIMEIVLKKYQEKLARVTDEDLSHIRWMCGEALKVNNSPYESGIILSDEYEEANRWLGFIQGVLWVHGVYSIDEMREHNESGLHRERTGVQLP